MDYNITLEKEVMREMSANTIDSLYKARVQIELVRSMLNVMKKNLIQDLEKYVKILKKGSFL